jgi:hypothetical protein
VVIEGCSAASPTRTTPTIKAIVERRNVGGEARAKPTLAKVIIKTDARRSEEAADRLPFHMVTRSSTTALQMTPRGRRSVAAFM